MFFYFFDQIFCTSRCNLGIFTIFYKLRKVDSSFFLTIEPEVNILIERRKIKEITKVISLFRIVSSNLFIHIPKTKLSERKARTCTYLSSQNCPLTL